MSISVMSFVWGQSVGDAGKKMVLLKLADCANDEGYCYPSQERIARECEMSRRTVQRKLDELVADGWIERWKTRSFEKGEFSYNCYTVTMRQSDALPQDTVRHHRAPKLDAVTITTEPPDPPPAEKPPSSAFPPPAGARSGNEQIELLEDPPFSAGVGGSTGDSAEHRKAKDPIWDEMTSIFFKPASDTSRGMMNQACKGIRQELGASNPDIGYEDTRWLIARRWMDYKKLYSDPKTHTPMGFSNQWPNVVAQSEKTSRPLCANERPEWDADEDSFVPMPADLMKNVLQDV